MFAHIYVYVYTWYLAVQGCQEDSDPRSYHAGAGKLRFSTDSKSDTPVSRTSYQHECPCGCWELSKCFYLLSHLSSAGITIFFEDSFFICMGVCLQRPDKGIRSAQSKGIVTSHHLGPGNRTWVVWKSSQHSHLLSGLFSPLY